MLRPTCDRNWVAEKGNRVNSPRRIWVGLRRALRRVETRDTGPLALARQPGLLKATLSLLSTLAIVAFSLRPAPVFADVYPPIWPGFGGGDPAHYDPVAWPADGAFTPYTQYGVDITDPRHADPSNGGTAPQNFVNVSSSCPDTTAPSVRIAYDGANQVLFFRWRTEQRANTYATGPSAGNFSASDPWNSALWTVLIDLDGDTAAGS